MSVLLTSERLRLAMMVVVFLLVNAFVGCGAKDETNEARLLIDRLEGLDSDDLQDRRRRVDALLAMPLEGERVRATHEVCAPMHDAMVSAEEATAELRAMVQAAEAGDSEAAARADAAADASAEALDRVQELRPQCEAQLTELRTRYSPRR